jgi:hypothetical protein
MNFIKNIVTHFGLKHSEQELTSQDFQFMRFVTEYGKTYATKAEFEFRSALFKD